MENRFVWYDLLTTDLDAAMQFYGEVTGWSHKDSGMAGPAYHLISAGERPIAGALELTEAMCATGVTPCWLGHIYVDDIDAALVKLRSLGGAVHQGKTAISGVGWFAVVTDPQGAGFHLFQNTPEYPLNPDLPRGALGKIGWRELLASDWEAVWPFYEAMFGWKKNEAHDMGPAGIYQLWRAYGNDPDGGMFTKQPDTPRPMWVFYFLVDGAQAAAQRIQAAGGQVLNGPMEVPGGGWVLQARDPQGAIFALLSGAP